MIIGPNDPRHPVQDRLRELRGLKPGVERQPVGPTKWTVLLVHVDGQHSTIVFTDDSGMRDSKARAETLAARESCKADVVAALVFKGPVVAEYTDGRIKGRGRP